MFIQLVSVHKSVKHFRLETYKTKLHQILTKDGGGSYISKYEHLVNFPFKRLIRSKGHPVNYWTGSNFRVEFSLRNLFNLNLANNNIQQMDQVSAIQFTRTGLWIRIRLYGKIGSGSGLRNLLPPNFYEFYIYFLIQI